MAWAEFRGRGGRGRAGDPGGCAPCGKAEASGAGACLFKCQGLHSRPGSPEPDLQSRPSRSGACCSSSLSGSCDRPAASLLPSPSFRFLPSPRAGRGGAVDSAGGKRCLPPSSLKALRSQGGKTCVAPPYPASLPPTSGEEELKSPHLQSHPRSLRVRPGAPPRSPGPPPLGG